MDASPSQQNGHANNAVDQTGGSGPQLAFQPTVSFTADNLRRNLWDNIRLFAEEVAEAAAEGKENTLQPEGWNKLNETVNSIQLCLFLLREPYLSPTQVWLGYNQCRVTDRVNFKLSAIGKEYDSTEEPASKSQKTSKSSPSGKGTKRPRKSPPLSPRETTSSKKSEKGTTSSRAGTKKTQARGAGTRSSRASRSQSTRPTPSPQPEEANIKQASEMSMSLGNEVDSEEDRLDGESLTQSAPSSTTTTTTTTATSHSDRGIISGDVTNLQLHQLLALHAQQQELYRYQLLQHSLAQQRFVTPQAPAAPQTSHHGHHNLEKLASYVPASLTSALSDPARLPSGFASLLAQAEIMAEGNEENEDMELERRRSHNISDILN